MSRKQRQTEKEEENETKRFWTSWIGITIIVMWVIIIGLVLYSEVQDKLGLGKGTKSSTMSRSNTLPGMTRVDYGLE